MKTDKLAFTLIELLVVIVIIAVLASLLLTGIPAALNTAKKTKAGVEVKSLETALQNYYTEYHKWPQTDEPDPEAEAVRINGNIARMLQGDDVPAKNNSRRRAFMQFQTFANGDVSQPVNPWWKGGAPTDNNWYYFKVDYNFDNAVNGTGSSTKPPLKTVRKPVIVWTKNPDKGTFITSWDE